MMNLFFYTLRALIATRAFADIVGKCPYWLILQILYSTISAYLLTVPPRTRFYGENSLAVFSVWDIKFSYRQILCILKGEASQKEPNVRIYINYF